MMRGKKLVTIFLFICISITLSSGIYTLNMILNQKKAIQKAIQKTKYQCVAQYQDTDEEELSSDSPGYINRRIFINTIYPAAIKLAKPFVPQRFVKETVISASYTRYPFTVLAIITTESHFNPFSRSSAGAVGCSQVKPSVWFKYLKQKGVVTSLRDFYDPTRCPFITAAILEYFIEKYGHNLTKIARLYYCGEHNPKCFMGSIYARKIRKMRRYYIEKYTESTPITIACEYQKKSIDIR